MNQFTSKRRTKEWLRKLKIRAKDDFPTNQRGDVLLLLSSSGIYEPFLDDGLLGTVVARKYFEEGLDFLIGMPCSVIGYSGINYYAPHQEKDLQIINEGTIPFPLIMRTRTSSVLHDATTKEVTISSKAEYDQRVKMHLDAYEWRHFVRSADKQPPSYIWLPHPEYLDKFKEILRSIVPEEKRRQPIEEKLNVYYSEK